jgi:hypothetical protein
MLTLNQLLLIWGSAIIVAFALNAAFAKTKRLWTLYIAIVVVCWPLAAHAAFGDMSSIKASAAASVLLWSAMRLYHFEKFWGAGAR